MAHLVSVSVSTLLIPIVLTITIATFFIYKAIYDKHTNKVLESGETKKRKWLAPWGLALIVLGAQLILIAGVMLPIYMFTVDTSTVEPSYEQLKEMPLTFEVSDTEPFEVDEKAYSLISTYFSEGLNVNVYKYEKAGDYDYYIFLAEIDKEPHCPMSIYIDYDNNDHTAVLMCELTAVCDGDKAYIKCEAIADVDTPAALRIGLKNKTVNGMSSTDTDYDKDVELTF